MYYLKDSDTKLKDIKDISDIERSCFINPWVEKQWNYEVDENPVAKVLVIKQDDKVIAYLDYWITFDSATIAKICVIDSYRRQGLASKLMEAMNKDLKENDVLYVTLEVRVSNIGAIKLYENYGFKAITTKSNYYSDGEDALYMVKEVN